MPRVCSFDLDGCLFHNNYPLRYNEMLHENAVIEVNRDLFNAILSDTKEDPLYVMIGSARQTHELDRSNTLRNHTEPGFQAITKVADHLKAKIHPLLLADVYRDLPMGTTFQRALVNEYDGPDYERFEFDESKITILYAQMHDFANLMGSEKVNFDFYDDRYPGDSRVFLSLKKNILKHLGIYYTRYPEMIPAQITLRLFHYEGGARSLLFTIQGTGKVDLMYRDTVKKMMQLSQTTLADCEDHLFMSKSPFHVSPRLLRGESFEPPHRMDLILDGFPMAERSLIHIHKYHKSSAEEAVVTVDSEPARNCRYRFFAATVVLSVTTLATCYYAMQRV